MGKLLANNTLMVLLLAAVLVVISIWLLGWAYRSTLDGVEWQEWIHEVEEGESLWTISGEYCPKRVDRREWIEEVKVLNGLRGSVIHPGQKLIVLVAPLKEVADE